MMKNLAKDVLLQSLIKCIAACEACADGCLEEQDANRMAQCIRTDRDCADICTLTARYVARNSPHLPGVLQQCIIICRACEEECRQHDMDHCRACAAACAECLAVCEERMAAMA